MSGVFYPLLGLIPACLIKIPHWTLWYRTFSGAKMPCRKVTEPDRWMPFDEAAESMDRLIWDPAGVDGIGFHLGTEQSHVRLVGIDLDDSIESFEHYYDGVSGPTDVVFKSWAKPIVQRWTGYLEISPSGRGVKGLGWGQLDPKFATRSPVYEDGQKAGEIELYGHDRYFTLTGLAIPGYERERLTDVQAAVDAICREWGREISYKQVAGTDRVAATPEEIEFQMLNRPNGDGAKNRKLWSEAPNPNESNSEKDFHLAKILAYWCDWDEQMAIHLWLNRSNRGYATQALRGQPEKLDGDYYPRRTVRAAIGALQKGSQKFNWKRNRIQNPLSWGDSNTHNSKGSYGALVEIGALDPPKESIGWNLDLFDNGFTWHLGENLFVDICLPMVSTQIGFGCEKIRVTLQKKTDSEEMNLLNLPCRSLSCKKCGPQRRDINRRWYGSIFCQLDEVYRYYYRTRARNFPQLWVSIPVGNGVRCAFLSRPVADRLCERLDQPALIEEVNQAFARWQSGRVSASPPIRLPDLDKPESNKWLRYPTQCQFKQCKTLQDVLGLMQGVGIRPSVREMESEAGHSVRFRATEAQLIRLFNLADDGFAVPENGTYEFHWR